MIAYFPNDVYYRRHKTSLFLLKAIRDLRKEKGISQDVLSGFAGIARTHLTMIENGTKQANFETLWKIALALDIRPSELVARIEEEIENHT